MKAFYNISFQRRGRLILGLSAVLAVIFLSSLVENWQLKEMNKDMSSLYVDRLIPASDIYYVSQLLHQKEKELIEFPSDVIQHKHLNHAIDSLLNHYEATYFVPNEKQYLQEFVSNYEKLKTLEISKLETSNKADLFALYSSMQKLLSQLIDVQSEVGEELKSHSFKKFYTSNQLYYFRLALTVLVVFLIVVLLVTVPKRVAKKIFKPNLKVVKNTDFNS
ncbi:MCP four helix bundle domain-containing protein [Joostella sp. CR20]|uniref:MCP four helix bundle domain-containing protein n=1 Tax=Joostella sp. CR20 TaxID=2804312 RepID=UPI00313ACE50